jgi:hemerythrin superfamily protein
MKFETATPDDENVAGSPAAGDAIELLMADHEDVRMLFADYEDLVAEGASAEERGQLARQICSELIAHSTAEEEIFYPAAREAIELPELVDQAETEHSSAMALIAQIQRMDPADDEFDALVTQLQEAVDQHVHEEEGELLPRVQESELDLESLGEQIAQRKEEVLAELEEAE